MLTQALGHSSCGSPRVYFGQDDTLLRKASRKIPGTRYARDPLILIRFQDETNSGRVPAWQDHVGSIHSS